MEGQGQLLTCPTNRNPLDHTTQIEPTCRIISTGNCTYAVHDRNFACSCNQGIFVYDIGTSGLRDNCKTCGHLLSEHSDAQSLSEELMPSKPEDITASYKMLPRGKSLIDMDPGIIHREATTASLFIQLQEVRVVHVRGTPASGKSTLSLLLHDHIRNIRPDILLYWEIWNSNHKIDWTDWRYRENVVLIIDEAQGSYNDNEFWAFLVKPVADTRTGPMIALFGSYGSPTQGPGLQLTPMYFAPAQRMSIRPLQTSNTQLSIFFTREEFENVIALISNQSGLQGQPFRLSTDCNDQLWLYSNGHPGGIVALLKVLMDDPGLRKHRKSGTEIPVEDLRDTLDDEPHLFSALQTTGFWRSFPPKNRIQNEAGLANFFLSVLIADRSKDDPQENKFLQLCYHNGWLQAELTSANDTEVSYVFPSRIHKGYIESILRSKSRPFPSHKFPSLEDFCFSVLRAFSSSSLASDPGGLGTGAIQRPREAQYQDEVYRAAYEILGQQIYLSSEWSPIGLNGRVDFRVKSMNWAIEYVREGDRLQQHVARFQEGGKYHRWIQNGSIKEYIIIDFRTSMPSKFNFVAPHLFFAVFDHDFRSCHIYDSSGEKKDQFAVLA